MNLSVELKNISFKYGASDQKGENFIFEDLNLNLKPESWCCLLGKSGCGKSTLLKVIANLKDQKDHLTGEILLRENEKQINLENYISYMAQDDLLFPWLNVIQNISIEEYLKTGKISDLTEAIELLTKLGLEEYKDVLPHKLSGGMRQRVALARVLIQNKPLILMDEPFSALDPITKSDLQLLAHKLLKGRTVFLITHDPIEALILGDELYVMRSYPKALTQFFPYQKTPVQKIAAPKNRPRKLDADLLEDKDRLRALLEAKGDDNG